MKMMRDRNVVPECVEVALENWNFLAFTACDRFFEMLRRAGEEPETVDVSSLPDWFKPATLKLTRREE